MIKVEDTGRGFGVIMWPDYESGEMWRLVQESSAIDFSGKNENNGVPGSSFLWMGDKHHLDREAVKDLIQHLQHWYDHGDLDLNKEYF